MKLGLRRRVGTVGSMKISHWSTDRDVCLRGGPAIFINKSLVAGCSVSKVTVEKPVLHGEVIISRTS